MRTRFFAPFLLVALLGGCVAPQPDPRAQQVVAEATTPYITPGLIAPTLLPPPPAQGSAEWKRDLKTVLTTQRRASQADFDAAKAEQKIDLTASTRVLGPDFTRDRLPVTFALLDRVEGVCGQTVDTAKNYWNTNRPFRADGRIRTVDPTVTSKSYPSGHATCSRLLAEVLSQLMPERQEALRQRATEIAQHRIVAGMHYPHDLKGGNDLALILFGALQNSAAYRMDLDAARQEIAAMQTHSQAAQPKYGSAFPPQPVPLP